PVKCNPQLIPTLETPYGEGMILSESWESIVFKSFIVIQSLLHLGEHAYIQCLHSELHLYEKSIPHEVGVGGIIFMIQRPILYGRSVVMSFIKV
ncbi:MAG: hypothetical protein QXO45_03615, partial [Nitrososphaerota archaeon]